MLDRLTQSLDFHGAALLLRSERSRVLAGNIANADTPHYKARDFNFSAALAQASGALNTQAAARGGFSIRTHSAHLPAAGSQGTVSGAVGTPQLLYRVPAQTALDANTVDLDMERASFADNTLRYEASLRFINGQIRTLLTSISGQ